MRRLYLVRVETYGVGRCLLRASVPLTPRRTVDVQGRLGLFGLGALEVDLLEACDDQLRDPVLLLEPDLLRGELRSRVRGMDPQRVARSFPPLEGRTRETGWTLIFFKSGSQTSFNQRRLPVITPTYDVSSRHVF